MPARISRASRSSSGATPDVTGSAASPRTYETNVYFPPDTQACIFWLRNRRRQTWRDGPNAATADDGIDDIARLEAASESVRHRAGAPDDGGSRDGAPRDGN